MTPGEDIIVTLDATLNRPCLTCQHQLDDQNLRPPTNLHQYSHQPLVHSVAPTQLEITLNLLYPIVAFEPIQCPAVSFSDMPWQRVSSAEEAPGEISLPLPYSITRYGLARHGRTTQRNTAWIWFGD